VRLKNLVAGLCIAGALTSCAFEPEYPGEQMTSLPTDVAGVVTLGGRGLESSGGRSLLFAFGVDGELLGRLDGTRFYGNGATVFEGGIAALSGDAVTVLSPDGLVEVPIEQWRKTGSASNGDQAALWFGESRSSEYVLVDESGEVARGSVPGYVVATGYCGGTLFTVVLGSDDIHRLFEMTVVHAQREVGTFTLPDNEAFTARDLGCTSDGASAVVVTSRFEWQQPMRPEIALIDLTNGKVDKARAGIPSGAVGDYRGGPLTIIEGRIVWLTEAGEVMSTSIADAEDTQHIWSIPGCDNNAATLSVDDGVLNVLDDEGTPSLQRYDLLSGNTDGARVELPWLEPLIGAATGNTIYGVSGIETFAPR
jgi:hypothetical protein